ncbi:hypothetical protein CEP51_001487 [Fusarium floridanum]|uniref:Uncharacterized protein n=1 Tax=Fusarium floridanum TaxID=1325733 RepID=A0A428SGN2_9HYPO|nr:hypothetical protein CEP51_001487 [Fusarium floridanum]
MASFELRQPSLPRYDDSNKLLNLSSFLAPTKIPFSLLTRGSSSRERWTSQGGIESVEASDVGLPSDLCRILSNQPDLESTINSMPHTYIKVSDQLFEVDGAVADLARQRHVPDDQARWKNWALIVTYRSIPWKYLEPVSDDPTLVFPHLKHTLEACADGFPGLSNEAKIDLGLTLIESTRFPDMAWKKFAINQAKRVSVGVESPYLTSRIALAECLVNRIEGSMLRSAANLVPISSEETAPDERMHSIAGQYAIQRALNFMQVEALKSAEEVLEAWSPLTETPSPMEQSVEFRKAIILGRSLRQRGEFFPSAIKLEAARHLTEEPLDFVPNEDLRDLISELADSLREAHYSARAINILRQEIKRREGSYMPTAGKSLLDLSLAEVLYCRGLNDEAEYICRCAMQDFPRLKYEKIRACIILGKIHHFSKPDKARKYWTMALDDVNRLPSESLETSRSILRSLCDLKGPDELREQYQKQLSRLEAQGEDSEVKFWIAGMPEWEKFMKDMASGVYNYD